MTEADARGLLHDLFRTAVSSADPFIAIGQNLPEKPERRCLVVGAGKASAAMAQALEQAWPEVRVSGVVATRYGHNAPCRRVKVIEAGHPIPDDNSVAAAMAMRDVVQDAISGDIIVALISGGGSACLALPADGVTLADKQEITRQLLSSGAPIDAINTVRRSISAIKGGRLAAMAGPVPVHSLLISDVPGDDPSTIASGPTIAWQRGPQDAVQILERYDISVSKSVKSAIAAGQDTLEKREQDTARIIASPAMAIAAAAKEAKRRGCDVMVLGDAIEGEAADVARDIAKIVLHHASTDRLRPLVLISGGETTVTLPAACSSRGGRNTEFQLALALALQGRPNVWALAGDSDGIDGASNAAGAFIGPDSLTRAATAGLDLPLLLRHHRSYDAFAALGDLYEIGPTLTNVNDIRIQLVG